MNVLIKFIHDEEGLTAIEYVISASLLVVGLILIFDTYGSILASKLTSIINKIT